jgi:hypothetical protein
MGKPQRRFGKEFEAEAVRLVEVSGRTQRELRRLRHRCCFRSFSREHIGARLVQ